MSLGYKGAQDLEQKRKELEAKIDSIQPVSGGTGIENYMTNEFGFDETKTQTFMHREGTPVWEEAESEQDYPSEFTEYQLVETGSGDMNLLPLTDDNLSSKAQNCVLKCTHGDFQYMLPFVLYTKVSIYNMTIAMSQVVTGDFGSGYKVFKRTRNGATWGSWTLVI